MLLVEGKIGVVMYKLCTNLHSIIYQSESIRLCMHHKQISSWHLFETSVQLYPRAGRVPKIFQWVPVISSSGNTGDPACDQYSAYRVKNQWWCGRIFDTFQQIGRHEGMHFYYPAVLHLWHLTDDLITSDFKKWKALHLHLPCSRAQEWQLSGAAIWWFCCDTGYWTPVIQCLNHWATTALSACLTREAHQAYSRLFPMEASDWPCLKAEIL